MPGRRDTSIPGIGLLDLDLLELENSPLVPGRAADMRGIDLEKSPRVVIGRGVIGIFLPNWPLRAAAGAVVEAVLRGSCGSKTGALPFSDVFGAIRRVGSTKISGKRIQVSISWALSVSALTAVAFFFLLDLDKCFFSTNLETV